VVRPDGVEVAGPDAPPGVPADPAG
jgi:hypothetical protein